MRTASRPSTLAVRLWACPGWVRLALMVWVQSPGVPLDTALTAYSRWVSLALVKSTLKLLSPLLWTVGVPPLMLVLRS